ncbi:nuclease homologue [Shimia gijangensis]|uniref:Nuclease homologue n=1 Tax=Shimia gijangensis TaxID=1470563 RepID=A0A1M6JXB8_9RHOB|nr:nuclease homologue [Shimia gijangensis]
MFERFERDGIRTRLTSAQYKKLHQLLRLTSEDKIASNAPPSYTITSNLGTGWMSSRYLRPQGARVVASKQSNRRSLRASDIRVIDGDTVDIRGQTANVRLVGFNTPETRSPQCSAEREVGLQATARLRGLIRNAKNIEFERVACACRPGTEGTRKCNYGRQCGVLKTNGADVGSILISEGLAVRYICGRTSCPRRPGNWCR